jgi:RNA 3'-terminal phosphate cyclase-like protein
LLSQRSLLITGIRSNSEDPGIRDFEVSYLRLIERITNGTTVEISYTGTEVYVKPGLLSGGSVTHQCPDSRGVGWFLEPILVLGLFGKTDLKLTLRGITSNHRDVSVSRSENIARCFAIDN